MPENRKSDPPSNTVARTEQTTAKTQSPPAAHTAKTKAKTKTKKSRNPNKEMSLTGHLRELRNRLLICLALLITAVLVGLYFAPQIVSVLTEAGRVFGYRFVYIAPQELLMQYVSVALIFGLVVTLPVTFYQLWAFVRPGLKRNENMLFLFTIIFGLICFCIGVYFAYRIMMPFMLRFLISFSNGSNISSSVSVANYLNFLTTVFLIFGVVFELPVLSVLLTQLGLLKVSWMRKSRRVVIVVIFVVSALITPPDVVSQVMVAIPMIGLYELSIILCTVCNKVRALRRSKEDNESAA